MLRDNVESVYNLIPPPQSSIHKKHVYPKSKYEKDNDTFMTLSKFKRPTATFGHPLGALKPQPNNYLKKNSKEPPNRTDVIYTPRARFKPPLLRDRWTPIHHSEKDYISENALQVIHATPQKLPKHIRSPIEKPDYGKIPNYLIKFNKCLEEKQNKINMLGQKQEGLGTQPNTRRLEESEKHELIEGLKKKWQQVNTAYQKISVVLDTRAKKARKQMFEAELLQIEKDIQTLSRRVVLVVDKGKSQSSTFSEGRKKHMMDQW